MFAKPGGIMRYWLPAVFVFLTGALAHAAPGEQDVPAPFEAREEAPTSSSAARTARLEFAGAGSSAGPAVTGTTSSPIS